MGEFKQFCIDLQEAKAVGFIDPKKFMKQTTKPREPKASGGPIPLVGLPKYKGVNLFHTSHSLERELGRNHSSDDIIFAAKKAVDLLKKKPDEFGFDVGIYSKRLGAAIIWAYKKVKGKPALVAVTILPKKSIDKTFMSKKEKKSHNKESFEFQPFLTENVLTERKNGYIVLYMIN